MYQVFSKGDISDLLAYQKVIHEVFGILEKPFISQESSFDTFQPSWCLDSLVWHHQIFILKWQRNYTMIIFLHSSFLQNMQKLLIFYWHVIAAHHNFAWRKTGSLKSFLYIILNISSRAMFLMEFFIPKWFDSTCDVDASLTATQWQLIESLLSPFIIGPTMYHLSLVL